MDSHAADTYEQVVPASNGGGLPAGAQAPTPAAPATADDVDLLEASWADAVEKVVDTNNDDPFMLNNAVAALRRDYLNKRYGKVVERIN